MGTNTAIVLVSGGLDSSVCIPLAQERFDSVGFLFANYGQKTLSKELECFHNLANHYGIPEERKLIADLTFLKNIGGSSLTDEKINVSSFDPDNKNIPSSYVPFRNTHILSTAVSWSELIGAKEIFIGANFEDSPGYPDCRPEYFKAFNNLIKLGSKSDVGEIQTPLLMMKKKEIVETGLRYKVPFEYTWSCYQSGDQACGVCDSCGLRLRGFKEAGAEDPINYQTKEEQ